MAEKKKRFLNLCYPIKQTLNMLRQNVHTPMISWSNVDKAYTDCMSAGLSKC